MQLMPSEENQTPERLDIARYRERYLGPLVALLLALQSIAFLLQLGFSVPIPWDLSFPEAAITARAADVARGEVPYHDWREWPHSFAPYGPLTYYVAGIATRGASVLDLNGELRVFGRVQSIVFLIGIAALAATMLRLAGLPWRWAALGPLAFLSWMETDLPAAGRLLQYVASFRPDAPQVFFSLAALAVAMRPGKGGRGRPLAALALLTISMWYKATSWGMIAALAFWLWRGRGARSATFWLAGFAIAGLLPVWYLDRRWDGLLLLNLMGSLDNGIEPLNFRLMAGYLNFQAWIVLIFGLGVACVNWLKVPLDSPRYLLSIATLTTAGATFMTTFKVGADVNYFLELYALCAVNCVLAVDQLWHLGDEDPNGDDVPLLALRREIPLTILLLPLLLFQAGQTVMEARTNLEGLRRTWRVPPMMERVAEIGGPVLSVYPCVALASGEPVGILDHYQYRVLAGRKRLPTRPLLDRIRNQEFNAVVIGGTLEAPNETYYTTSFIDVLRENYVVSDSYGPIYTVLTPKPAWLPLVGFP